MEPDDPEIENYLTVGWESHMLCFNVTPVKKSLKVTLIDKCAKKANHRWDIDVRGLLVRSKRKKMKMKFIVYSELLSSPRDCVFVKFKYHLSTLDSQVLLRRGRKCCIHVRRRMEYHINNIDFHANNMIFTVYIVSETAKEAGLLDLMKTAQEIKPSQAEGSGNENCRNSFDIDMERNNDDEHNADDEDISGCSRKNNDKDSSTAEDESSLQKCTENEDCEESIWEKFKFSFKVTCTQNSEYVVSEQKSDTLMFSKWVVTGYAVNFGDFIVLSVHTKLWGSPRRVSFAKFLFNASTKEGITLQNFEIKRCYRVFEHHRCQLRTIPKTTGDVFLNVLIMSDTYDKDYIDSMPSGYSDKIIIDDSIVDQADSDDDVMIVEDENSLIIPNISIKQEKDCESTEIVDASNVVDEQCSNITEQSLYSNSIFKWEKCVCLYRISYVEAKSSYNVEYLSRSNSPKRLANVWFLSVTIHSPVSVHKGDIYLNFELKSSPMSKVLVKFFFRLSTRDGRKIFNEKYCFRLHENRIHSLRNIELSSVTSFLEVVILSEAAEDSESIQPDISPSKSSSSTETVAFQNSNVAAQGINNNVVIECKEAKLIADAAKLASCSAIFSKVIDNTVATTNIKHIEMTEFSTASICQLLAYIDESNDFELGWKSATDILRLSVKYEISPLKNDCEVFLVSALNESNVMKLLLLADTCAAMKLRQRAMKFICKNPEKFSTDNKYDELNERPDLLKEILIGVTSRTVSKRKRSSDKNDGKKEKRNSAVRNLENDYLTNEEDDNLPD